MSCNWRKVFNGGRGGYVCGLCEVLVNNKQQKALHEIDMHPAESEYLAKFGEFPVPPEVIEARKNDRMQHQQHR